MGKLVPTDDKAACRRGPKPSTVHKGTMNTVAKVGIGIGIGATVVTVTVLAYKALKPAEVKKPIVKANYVGSGWIWPRPDRFPDVASFGHTLNELGYGAAVGLPGWEILSTETMNTIMAFQSDYAAVRAALLKEAGVELPFVITDGLVGDSTIRALIFAQDFERNNPDDSWIALVTDARAG